MDFRRIEYLKDGTPRQRVVYDCLCKYGILSSLSDFDPVVVSTICLDVDIDSSDIDVVCYAKYLSEFKSRVLSIFGKFPGFCQHERVRPYPAVIASFRVDSFEVEIFGVAVPVEKQDAYRHLSVLARLIEVGGEEFRDEIRRLKVSGLKTEPAIAESLNLSGNPYAAVLELESLGDIALRILLAEGFRKKVPCTK